MRYGRVWLACFAAAALCACASTPPPPGDLPGEVIVYEANPGPFCGPCRTLKITVADDGRVWIERGQWYGSYEDWRERRELKTVDSAPLAAFTALLARYRPKGEVVLRDQQCETYFSDMPETRVSWRGPKGSDKLIYDFGCDPKTYARMRSDLIAAAALLGIAMPEQSWAATTRLH